LQHVVKIIVANGIEVALALSPTDARSVSHFVRGIGYTGSRPVL
jgi:hypothetical protein